MKNITENRKCQNCGDVFLIEPEDFKFYEKMQVPPPTFCPDCRFQRRLLFRNNRVLYRRECALCKKPMLSVYQKDRPYTVYCRECWLSDRWSPVDYGVDYNFSKNFFEQLQDLQQKVPRANLYQTNFVSSEYCSYGLDFKECYLLFGGHNDERIYFSTQVFDSRDSMDLGFCEKIEFSYELFECKRTNMLFFSHHCVDCIASYYLVDCKNCINCFGCVGLVNKQYHIFNKPYTKEEYLKFVKDNQGSYQKHIDNLQKLNKLKLSVPHKYARITQSINSTGDDLTEVRNTHNAFSSRQAEDSRFLFFCRHGSKDCYDVSFLGFNAELVYENCHGFGGSDTAFGVRNLSNQSAKYNVDCHDSKNIFGCEGLRKKEYCILNKEYSKEEYRELLPRIIEHMKKTKEYGEFFPSKISPFAYNETIAQEYFPLTKDEAVAKGYLWQDLEDRNYRIDIKGEDLPDSISEVGEDAAGKVISCIHSGKCKDQCTEAFKILPEEFKFYKRMSIPLPRLCPNCRHYQRLKLRNPLKLWDRACMCSQKEHFHGEGKCPEEFKTTYAPERPEIIYCERCYQSEIY